MRALRMQRNREFNLAAIRRDSKYSGGSSGPVLVSSLLVAVTSSF